MWILHTFVKNKIMYQPVVIKKAEKFIVQLKSINFFEEEEIRCTNITMVIICDVLTDKFINGTLSDGDDIGCLFNKEEFSKIIGDIKIAESLSSLYDKGLIESVEDENNELVYFLTDKGKEFMGILNKND